MCLSVVEFKKFSFDSCVGIRTLTLREQDWKVTLEFLTRNTIVDYMSY